VKSYPNSPFAVEAKKLSSEVQRKMAKHEVYVADFYERRGRWSAVANRLEMVAQKYPGLGFDQEALFRLHDVYLKLKDPQRARDALRRVVERFPGTDAASKAQEILDQGS
jgi:outer membrane protein assembly factor BamD